MKKIFVYLSVVLAMFLGVMTVVLPTEVQAGALKDGETPVNCGSNSFFLPRPWYYKLTVMNNSRCEIGTPGELPKFVWTIVLNILYDISVLVGYLAIIMFAWGGYLYMFSRGLPDRAERGKKTLISAVVGVAITMLASIILNTIVTILTSTS